MTFDPTYDQTLSHAGDASAYRRSATAGTIDGSIFNPALIGIGIVYVLWSYVHLPSSIWVRSLLACYLIWRMKPDVIIPYVLTCAQLRVDLIVKVGGDAMGEMSSDMAGSLTGFEQYAFALPCVVQNARTLVAALSARVVRRAEFPFWLYGLYLIGMLFVVTGAIYASGSRGWTAAVREYGNVGLYFYGLLLMACSPQKCLQLAAGFSVIGMLVVVANILVGYHSRQLWVLLPIAGSCAPLLILRGGKILWCASGVLYAFVGFVFAYSATFTVLLLWAWNLFAGVLLGLFRGVAIRRVAINVLTYGLFVISFGMLFYGAFAHDSSLDLHATIRAGQGSTFDRMTFKLCSDRGPLWWGAMQELLEHPTLCGNPAPAFMIRALGKDQLWTFSTHSIWLDPLLHCGCVAGPLLLFILIHMVIVSKNAIANNEGVGVAMLGLAVISNVVLGGATLPYVLQDRSAEHLLMAAGLLGVYGMRKGASRVASPQTGAHRVPPSQALPAA